MPIEPKLLSKVIVSTMSLNQRFGGGLKNKNRLALRSFKYLGTQHLSVGRVGLHPEDIREAVFEVDPPDDGQLPGPIEIGNHVNV